MNPYYFQSEFPIQSDFPMNNFGTGFEWINGFSDESFVEGFLTGITSGVMMGYLVLIAIFIIAVYILSSYALMKLAVKIKAGRPWFAWIPILRMILWLNLGGFSGWYIFTILLLGIPFLGWLVFTLFYVYVWIRVCIACGKPGYLGLLTIIPAAALFLPLYLVFSEGLEKK